MAKEEKNLTICQYWDRSQVRKSAARQKGRRDSRLFEVFKGVLFFADENFVGRRIHENVRILRLFAD